MEHQFYTEDNINNWTEVQKQLWRVYQNDLNLFFLYFPNPFAPIRGTSTQQLIDDLFSLIYSFYTKHKENIISGNWGLLSLFFQYSDFAGDQIYFHFVQTMNSDNFDYLCRKFTDSKKFKDYLVASLCMYKHKDENEHTQRIFSDQLNLNEYTQYFDVISISIDQHLPQCQQIEQEYEEQEKQEENQQEQFIFASQIFQSDYESEPHVPSIPSNSSISFLSYEDDQMERKDLLQAFQEILVKQENEIEFEQACEIENINQNSQQSKFYNEKSNTKKRKIPLKQEYIIEEPQKTPSNKKKKPKRDIKNTKNINASIRNFQKQRLSNFIQKEKYQKNPSNPEKKFEKHFNASKRFLEQIHQCDPKKIDILSKNRNFQQKIINKQLLTNLIKKQQKNQMQYKNRKPRNKRKQPNPVDIFSIREAPKKQRSIKNTSYRQNKSFKSNQTNFDSLITYFFSPTKNMTSNSRTPIKKFVKEEQMEIEQQSRQLSNDGSRQQNQIQRYVKAEPEDYIDVLNEYKHKMKNFQKEVSVQVIYRFQQISLIVELKQQVQIIRDEIEKVKKYQQYGLLYEDLSKLKEAKKNMGEFIIQVPNFLKRNEDEKVKKILDDLSHQFNEISLTKSNPNQLIHFQNLIVNFIKPSLIQKLYLFQDYLFEFMKHELDISINQINPLNNLPFRQSIQFCFFIQIKLLSTIQRINNVFLALNETELIKQIQYAISMIKSQIQNHIKITDHQINQNYQLTPFYKSDLLKEHHYAQLLFIRGALTLLFEWFDYPNKYSSFTIENQRLSQKLAKYSDLQNINNLAKKNNSVQLIQKKKETLSTILYNLLIMVSFEKHVQFGNLTQFIPYWIKYLKELLAVSQIYQLVLYTINMRSIIDIDSNKVFQLLVKEFYGKPLLLVDAFKAIVVDNDKISFDQFCQLKREMNKILKDNQQPDENIFDYLLDKKTVMKENEFLLTLKEICAIFNIAIQGSLTGNIEIGSKRLISKLIPHLLFKTDSWALWAMDFTLLKILSLYLSRAGYNDAYQTLAMQLGKFYLSLPDRILFQVIKQLGDMIDTKMEIRTEEDWKQLNQKNEPVMKIQNILLNESIVRWKDSRNYGLIRTQVIEESQERQDIFLEDILKWLIVFLKKGLFAKFHILDEIHKWLEYLLNDKYEIKCSTRSWIYNVLEECLKEDPLKLESQQFPTKVEAIYEQQPDDEIEFDEIMNLLSQAKKQNYLQKSQLHQLHLRELYYILKICKKIQIKQLFRNLETIQESIRVCNWPDFYCYEKLYLFCAKCMGLTFQFSLKNQPSNQLIQIAGMNRLFQTIKIQDANDKTIKLLTFKQKLELQKKFFTQSIESANCEIVSHNQFVVDFFNLFYEFIVIYQLMNLSSSQICVNSSKVQNLLYYYSQQPINNDNYLIINIIFSYCDQNKSPTLTLLKLLLFQASQFDIFSQKYLNHQQKLIQNVYETCKKLDRNIILNSNIIYLTGRLIKLIIKTEDTRIFEGGYQRIIYYLYQQCCNTISRQDESIRYNQNVEVYLEYIQKNAYVLFARNQQDEIEILEKMQKGYNKIFYVAYQDPQILIKLSENMSSSSIRLCVKKEEESFIQTQNPHELQSRLFKNLVAFYISNLSKELRNFSQPELQKFLVSFLRTTELSQNLRDKLIPDIPFSKSKWIKIISPISFMISFLSKYQMQQAETFLVKKIIKTDDFFKFQSIVLNQRYFRVLILHSINLLNNYQILKIPLKYIVKNLISIVDTIFNQDELHLVLFLQATSQLLTDPNQCTGAQRQLIHCFLLQMLRYLSLADSKLEHKLKLIYPEINFKNEKSTKQFSYEVTEYLFKLGISIIKQQDYCHSVFWKAFQILKEKMNLSQTCQMEDQMKDWKLLTFFVNTLEQVI